MAYATSTYLAIATIAASLVGSGVSYYSSTQAAKTQEQLGLANAQAATQAARQAGQAASMQAMINQSLADKEKAAALANAESLRTQAEIGTRIATENTRRTREESARLAAIQRQSIAKNGFVDTTGSPLALLVDTAEAEQQQADAIRFEDESNRRALFREASIETNNATMAGIQGLGYAAGGAAARGQSMMAISQAKLDAFGARASAQAIRTQATGNLITSAGSLSGSIYSGYRDGTFRRTPATARAIR